MPNRKSPSNSGFVFDHPKIFFSRFTCKILAKPIPLDLNIFLWLPDRTEDWPGLLRKIINFWEMTRSRVVEGDTNNGFGGFVRFNNIVEKNHRTSFKDR